TPAVGFGRFRRSGRAPDDRIVSGMPRSAREGDMTGPGRFVAGLAAVLVLAATPVYAQAQAPAGHIKTVTGGASIIRGGSAIAATPGAAIYATDTLRTGADGAVGVTLQDDTRVSL